VNDKRRLALLAIILVATVFGSGLLIEARQADDEPVQRLVDVTEGSLQDGWGETAVETLSMYYSADSSKSGVQMLAFRRSFLPVFDWANGTIPATVGGDLYSFYASGAGASRVQFEEDPAYALRFRTRYQEPAGRPELAADAGYALGLGASQSRVVTSDYQNWQDAGVGTASGMAQASLETAFTLSDSYAGFGASLTRYRQRIKDTERLSQLSRQAWQESSSGAIQNLWSARKVGFETALPSTLTPPQGFTGEAAAISQRLLGNYFSAGTSGQGNFIRSSVKTDVLSQWAFDYDPNLAGTAHVFHDDAGRVRFFRGNADLSDEASQGFRYIKYDQWSRVIEVGVLVAVAKSSFADYAQWAREADLDQQLTGANSCAVYRISYDADPVTGTLTAYDERRGAIAKRSYHPTAIADQPTDCPGRGEGDPINESLYRYDDLGRTTLLSEHRQSASANIYRTTQRSWPSGGLLAQTVFPDEDQDEAFLTIGQGLLTLWPDVLGRALRQCAGEDCSGVVYSDITQFDWTASPLTVVAGNGVSEAYAYDLRGRPLSRSASLSGTVLFAESLRDMQFKDGENPCPGSAELPDYSAGLLIARALSGTGLPQEDQGIWNCYSYDGGLRLSRVERYATEGQSFVPSSSFTYGYDANGNVLFLSQTGQGSASFTRAGSDQITAASLASNASLTFTYDATYGQITGLAGSGSTGYSLAFSPEALLHLPVSQTVKDATSGAALLSAAIDYDASGLRASRTVSAGTMGQGSSTTSYWYGGALHPIVVTRDGVNYRLIGKSVVEEAAAQPTRSYLYADHLGSVRVVTDDQGSVIQSLGYDDDYGSTRIAGHAYASSDDAMASFYRFQGQEQEVFPLAKLGIDNNDLAQWLDDLQLYHFPWRDYAAGLASFTQTDPIPTEDSLYSAFAANPVNFTDETGGMLGNFEVDPEVQNLLDRILADPHARLSRAQLEKMTIAFYTVMAENPSARFAPERTMREAELERLRTADINRVVIGIAKRQKLDFKKLTRSDEKKIIAKAKRQIKAKKTSLMQQEAEEELRSFDNWVLNYQRQRRKWLDKYSDALSSYVRSFNAADDQIGDEKDVEEDDEKEEKADDTQPLLGADQQENGTGVPNRAPAQSEFNGRQQDDDFPRFDDNRPLRCCNIL
jgi:RHS repeat-associated protein